MDHFDWQLSVQECVRSDMEIRWEWEDQFLTFIEDSDYYEYHLTPIETLIAAKKAFLPLLENER